MGDELDPYASRSPHCVQLTSDCHRFLTSRRGALSPILMIVRRNWNAIGPDPSTNNIAKQKYCSVITLEISRAL